jgi:hypothetical protein
MLEETPISVGDTSVYLPPRKETVEFSNYEDDMEVMKKQCPEGIDCNFYQGAVV